MYAFSLQTESSQRSTAKLLTNEFQLILTF